MSVICSSRAYTGVSAFSRQASVDGVVIRRVRALGFGRSSAIGRLADYASYLTLASLKALLQRPRPDLIVALTTPPYLGLTAAVVARLRGSAHAHWVMDIYPDALAAHGMLRRESVLFRWLEALARFQYKTAAAVLTLGPFMRRKKAPYLGPGVRAEGVPLWSSTPVGRSDGEAAAEVRRERGWKPGDLVLLYSGNMGLGHRFGEFLEAARRLGPTGPIWAFRGEGPRRGEIETFAQAHPEARLGMLPYVPVDRLVASLSAADVHLVSLDSAWQGLIVPSKLQGSFAVGRPVIFVGGRDNEVAAWIEESGGGWRVAENDVTGLIEAVEEAREPVERRRRGDAALDFARKHFDREMNCTRIAEILEGCVTRSFAPPGEKLRRSG